MKVLRAKRRAVALKLCTGSPETVADKLRFARLSAGIKQEELAAAFVIDRATLLRAEDAGARIKQYRR